MKTTHLALEKQKRVLKQKLDELDNKLEQGENLSPDQQKLKKISFDQKSGRVSPLPKISYLKQVDKMGQSVDLAALQTNSLIVSKDWASGQIQTPQNLDTSFEILCNSPQIKKIDTSFLFDNSVDSDVNFENPVINLTKQKLRKTMFQPSPKPLSTIDYNKILTKPIDVKLSSLMKQKITQIGQKMTDQEMFEYQQKELEHNDQVRKKIYEESRSVFNTSNLYQKSMDQTKMSDASKMSRTSGFLNESAMNVISGALWTSQNNNLRTSPGLQTYSNFSKSPSQTIQVERKNVSKNAENLRLSLDSFEFVPEQPNEPNESVGEYSQQQMLMRRFPASVRAKTLMVSPSGSPRMQTINPPSFVYHTPHNGIKINSGESKIVIQQKFIDRKYKNGDFKEKEGYQLRKKPKQLLNRSVVLEPLPKPANIQVKDDLENFFREARLNYQKYEYDGPEDMSRTPLSHYEEKPPVKNSTKKQIQVSSKMAQKPVEKVASNKKPTKNTVDPILKNVQQCAKEYIQNEQMVGKQNMLQTSIITILRGYESKRINAGGTSLDNTERLMQQFYDYRDQGFGPRHHRQGMQDFMNLTSDNRKLEKFVVDVNHDKLKSMESGAIKKNYRGLKAPGLLMQVDRDQWIEKRKMGEKFKVIKERRNFIKEIFNTIDEDGSGKLEKQEIIKALLCMGLCKDSTFAKRIIKVFRANQLEERVRINRKKEARGEFIIEDESLSQSSHSFGLRDFIAIFSEDKVGKSVIEVINQEIQGNEDTRIRATAEKRLQESREQWQKFGEAGTQEMMQSYDQSLAPQVKDHVKKFLQVQKYEKQKKEEQRASYPKIHSPRNAQTEGAKEPLQDALGQMLAKKGTLNFKMNALSTYGKNLHNEIQEQQIQIENIKKTGVKKDQPKIPVCKHSTQKAIEETTDENLSVDLSAESRLHGELIAGPGQREAESVGSFSSMRSEEDFDQTLNENFGAKGSLKQMLAKQLVLRVGEKREQIANPLMRRNQKRSLNSTSLNQTVYQETVRQQKEKLEQKQIENVRKLKNDMQNQLALREMEEQVKESMQSVSKDLGPSIGMQSAIVEGWWKKMAEEYNPNIHHSFVRDIPLPIVTKFLVKKGVVQDEHNANMLYKHDIGDSMVHGANLKMSWDDFMLIVSKRMFRDALLQVTKTIQKIAKTSLNSNKRDADLVLSISEYQRRFMINLNTKTDGQDSSVMKSLDTIKQQENQKREQIRQELKAKEAHLTEKFKIKQRAKTPESGDEALKKGADGSAEKGKDEDSDNAEQDEEDTAIRGTANEEVIESLIGGEAGMIRHKRNMTYEQFIDDPFGLKKRALQREVQAQRLKQQMIQQAIDREERRRSQMANGELANREGQDSTDSSVPAKHNSKNIEGEIKIEGDAEEDQVVLTLSSNIQKPEIHSDFMAMQTRQILRTNKQHYDLKPIPIDAAGFIVSPAKPSKSSKEQMPLVLVPRVYLSYNKVKAQKFVDQTVNLRAYQQSLGQNGIKYKLNKRSQAPAEDIPQTVGDHISENSDIQER